MIGKFGLSNMPLSSNRLSMSIDLSQYKHEIILVQLFILCTQFSKNDQMTFCMYSVLYTFLNHFFILFDNKLSNGLFKNNINVSIPLEPLFDHSFFALLNLQTILSFVSFCLNKYVGLKC